MGKPVRAVLRGRDRSNVILLPGGLGRRAVRQRALILPTSVAPAFGSGSSPAFGFMHMASKRWVDRQCKEKMMWCSAVGCIVTLTLSLLAAPLTGAAQPR